MALPAQPTATCAAPPLVARRCRPLGPGAALDAASAALLLQQVPAWHVEGGFLTRVFSFTDHWETLAFVNATAWVTHREDHHPELAIGFDRCQVRFTTHSAGGLSENDFICAAKFDALLALC
ncbi:MAG: 4a-hydroxytetrahydrobiopterin dehydratase [Burkholderiales bacterium]|jgi:4a-hydroxytetrahydrobiopterin dehydratase|nr:4a-hydroxytetrahydrobiopterin dehydratase [Burkholderiales bacterium]